MGTGFKSLYHTLVNVLMTKDPVIDEYGRGLKSAVKRGQSLYLRDTIRVWLKLLPGITAGLRQLDKFDRKHIEKELEKQG